MVFFGGGSNMEDDIVCINSLNYDTLAALQ